VQINSYKRINIIKMKTYNEFIEEFRYLPKAKMDKKIRDREESGEGRSTKTQKIKLVRNVLGKNTKLSKSDNLRNARNVQRVFNKRITAGKNENNNVNTTIKTADKQSQIIKLKDKKSNKKNPTEYDTMKREYEILKQDIKNRSETDTKRIINARKKLEKAFNSDLKEKIVIDSNNEALDILDNLKEKISNIKSD
jgi:hypothetical protein